MLVVHRRWWQVAASLGLLAIIPHTAGAAGWMDDFNDGSITDNNPVTWVTNLGGAGPFNGVYDASSGDFFMDPDEFSLSGGQMSALVPIGLTDTYIRTQGIVLPTRTIHSMSVEIWSLPPASIRMT